MIWRAKSAHQGILQFASRILNRDGKVQGRGTRAPQARGAIVSVRLLPRWKRAVPFSSERLAQLLARSWAGSGSELCLDHGQFGARFIGDVIESAGATIPITTVVKVAFDFMEHGVIDDAVASASYF